MARRRHPRRGVSSCPMRHGDDDGRATFEPYALLRPTIVTGTESLARAAAAAGVARFVFASSTTVYDGAGGPADERTPPHPWSGYGRAKLDAERALAAVTGGCAVLAPPRRGRRPRADPRRRCRLAGDESRRRRPAGVVARVHRPHPRERALAPRGPDSRDDRPRGRRAHRHARPRSVSFRATRRSTAASPPRHATSPPRAGSIRWMTTAADGGIASSDLGSPSRRVRNQSTLRSEAIQS